MNIHPSPNCHSSYVPKRGGVPPLTQHHWPNNDVRPKIVLKRQTMLDDAGPKCWQRSNMPLAACFTTFKLSFDRGFKNYCEKLLSVNIGLMGMWLILLNIILV